MDWAIDQLGKLVHASTRSLFSYGFTCPTCGERVRRRAGSERRPHFAHFSFSAKPDCENYHPSSNEAIAIATRIWEREQRPSRLDALSVPGGVFLERSVSGRFNLILRLPRIRGDAGDLSGSVQVQSGLGVRQYSAAQLRRPQFIPLIPQIPLVQATATDQLAGAVPAIEDDISIFRTANNVFRVGNEGGRLLSPEEPLEWGESYRIFTQHPLGPAPHELPCNLVAHGGVRGWYVYEFDLPEIVANLSVGQVISHFLGRAIRHRSPRVFLVGPPPHHFDLDGAYIYPTYPDQLWLRRVGDCEPRIHGDAVAKSTKIDELEGWIVISGLNQGELTVQVGRQIQLIARIDECPLFKPVGVQLVVGDSTGELFEREVIETLLLSRGDVTIRTPSARVAETIRLNRQDWISNGSFYYRQNVGTEIDIDAGNFGCYENAAEELEPPLENQAETARAVSAAEIWLRGVLDRLTHGRSSLYLSDVVLAVREYPWLYPYIRRIHNRKGTH